jgi:hypothetical protein
MSQSFVPRMTPHDPNAKPPITTKRTSACKRRTRSWSNEGPLNEHAAQHRATRTACVSTRSSLRGSPRAAAAHPHAAVAAARAHPPSRGNVARIAQASEPTLPSGLLQNQTRAAACRPHGRNGPAIQQALTEARVLDPPADEPPCPSSRTARRAAGEIDARRARSPCRATRSRPRRQAARGRNPSAPSELPPGP